jgi:altronate hydrolase
MAAPRTLRLHDADNVVVTIDSLSRGKVIDGGVTVAAAVPRGHKVAVQAIGIGEPIRKFGQIIGFARSDIQPGDWVHEHNVAIHDFERDYAFASEAKA